MCYYCSFEGQFELPGSKPNYNPDKPVSVTHIFLDLNIDFDAESLWGKSNISVKSILDGVTKLDLNAVNMEISEIKINRKTVEFEYDGEILQVFLEKPTKEGQEFTISIDYKITKPVDGLSFIKPDEFYPDKPIQAWSKGESEGSRYWYPCFDYPKQICTTELKIVVPKNFTAISNGALVEEKIKNTQSKIFHWKMSKPHPNYLMMLGVGEFVEIKDNYKEIPVYYYTSKQKASLLENTANKTPKMIEFFSKKFGVNFPWDKYHQLWVADFLWGGMENTSATVNTEDALVDKKGQKDVEFPETLIAHELGHQWFGDLVAIDHWSLIWIKEGAATYCEQLWWEHEYGKEEMDYYRWRNEWSVYFAETKKYTRSLVNKIYRDTEDLYDGGHTYSKGGIVYHMIRSVLGEKPFEKFLQTFLEDNKHKNVEPIDLLRAIEKASGKNLLPLFDQYVFSPGHPNYLVKYSWDKEAKIAKLNVTQKQVTKKDDFENLFRLNIPISFSYLNKKGQLEIKEVKVLVDQIEQSFYFPLEKKPDLVVFDSGNNFLKELEIEYPFEDLKNQLLHASDVISKIYAITTISKKSNLEALKTLKEAFIKEKFWGVRVEIISGISKISLDQVYEALEEFLSTEKDVRVKTQIINALSSFKTEKTYQLIKNFVSKDPGSYYLEGASYKALGVIAKTIRDEIENKTVETLKEVLETKQTWNQVVESFAISGLAQLNSNPEALAIIKEYTKLGTPQRLRMTSIANLGPAAKNQSEVEINSVLDSLEEISRENYLLVLMSVISALEKIPKPRSIQILNSLMFKSTHGRLQTRVEEAIANINKVLDPKENMESLRKEFEEMKKENQTLKSRVEEIEAKKKVK